MRQTHLRAVVPADPDTVLEKFLDFTDFPTLSEDIREVRVLDPEEPGGHRRSEWEVNFRRGVMHWTEVDRVDRDRGRIDFDQLDGDFERLQGSWVFTAVADGCQVDFDVTYDFGIESLAGIMDPLAERVMKRAACDVLAGLFGRVTVTAGGSALTDLVDLPADSCVHVLPDGAR
jgi:ribosome-associated toxin RatA of RatAB toxin-antitoxin module